MTYLDLISYKHLSNYKISKEYHIPLTTLQDIASGKSSLLNCNGKTLLQLSRALDVSIEELLMLEPEEDLNHLPLFLRESIKSLRKGERKNSSIIDCCYDELASSINAAEVEHLISHETAYRLRKRYFVYD